MNIYPQNVKIQKYGSLRFQLHAMNVVWKSVISVELQLNLCYLSSVTFRKDPSPGCSFRFPGKV